MIKAYSQRLSPPYSGQIQIAESDRARAMSVDGEAWEFQFLRLNTYRRVAHIKHSELSKITSVSTQEGREVDERILELSEFLITANLPFPAEDIYEYWLLDEKDETPLALIFSCTKAEQMPTFPNRTEWTALPAAVMPITPTEDETQRCDSPVNYRLERLVAERAGSKPRARWFKRREHEPDEFPPLLLREDWQEEEHLDLCKRYINRQSTRLLMLHGLEREDRRRLEIAARPNAVEVERFYSLYPEVVDADLISALRVEARLRSATEENTPLHKRRDGVLYQ